MGNNVDRVKKEKILLTVVPSWGGRTRQFTISIWLLRLCGIAGSVLVLVLLLGLAMFGKIASGARSARRLGAENDSLRSQFGKLKSLERQIVELTRTNAQIRRMAGLESYRPGDSAGARSTDTPPRGGASGLSVGVKGMTLPHLTPHSGPISQGFEIGPNGEAIHPGLDIAGAVGTPIVASGGGVVVRAGADANYGNMIILDHGGGIQTVYGHASSMLVSEGDSVAEGQSIALLGNTGRSSAPHLHFEVRRDGVPVDPGLYVQEYRNQLKRK